MIASTVAVRGAPVSAAVSPKYSSGIEVAEILRHAIDVTHHAHAALFDEIHGPRGIALSDDDFTRAVNTRLELGEDDADHRLGRQLRERREIAEEALERVVSELEFEIRADIRDPTRSAP